jgi:L-seryl-tRNA(Ser) seleniumtransferase
MPDHTMTQPSALQSLPSIDQLLRQDTLQALITEYGRPAVLEQAKAAVAKLRTDLLNGAEHTREELIPLLSVRIDDELQQLFAPSLKPVLNLSGIVLHTNLGRASYPQQAIDAMVAVSRGASNLEYNLLTGKRGRRDDHVEQWICHLTGAEAATTVNNNAAAVMLVLNTLAAGKNVIVSRGELIEIGGSFRMPAIMQSAGCKLREVGTTNRTHLVDYENAISRKTAALMKVHPSNYEVQGFNKSVSARELSTLAQQTGLPLYDDLGSGSLVDLSDYGLPAERTARQALQDGCDLITFSGDKLLGGPQCGIIAGSRELIKKIDKNPMKRAMRLDKVTLAALEAALKLYANPEQLITQLPSLRMLTRSTDALNPLAEQLASRLRHGLHERLQVTVESCQSQIGSGSLPTRTLPSVAVVLRVTDEQKPSIKAVAGAFRQLDLPVIGRVHNDALWFDCRTLDDPQQVGLPTTLARR